MKCPACLAETPSNFQYCLHCGSDNGPITVVRRGSPTKTGPIDSPSFSGYGNPKTSGGGVVTFVGFGTAFASLVVLCLLAVGAVYLYTSPESNGQQPQPRRAALGVPTATPFPTPLPTATPLPTPTPRRVEALPPPRPISTAEEFTLPRPATIVSESFIVGARSFKAWNLNITSSEAIVTGRFRASGSMGNDIQCLILGDDAFENWRNNHASSALYNSGKTTVDTLHVRLSQGHYFLVFNNKFALLSNKAVTAAIQLEAIP